MDCFVIPKKENLRGSMFFDRIVHFDWPKARTWSQGSSFIPWFSKNINATFPDEVNNHNNAGHLFSIGLGMNMGMGDIRALSPPIIDFTNPLWTPNGLEVDAEIRNLTAAGTLEISVPQSEGGNPKEHRGRSNKTWTDWKLGYFMLFLLVSKISGFTLPVWCLIGFLMFGHVYLWFSVIYQVNFIYTAVVCSVWAWVLQWTMADWWCEWWSWIPRGWIWHPALPFHVCTKMFGIPSPVASFQLYMDRCQVGLLTP